MAAMTLPTAGLAEYASDPESAGARHGARTAGMPARTRSGLKMKVGKRGWGGNSATSTSSPAGGSYDDAAAGM